VLLVVVLGPRETDATDIVDGGVFESLVGAVLQSGGGRVAAGGMDVDAVGR